MLRQAHGSPKLAHLKALLGVPRFQAVGLLECLWHFTATQAPRGDVGKWSDGQIAAALEWPGDPAALVVALVESRWLDRCARHRLVVHDWQDHADQTVKRSPQVRELGFAQRLASDSLASDASVASDSLVKSSTSASVAIQPDPDPDPDPEPEPALAESERRSSASEPERSRKRARRTKSRTTPDQAPPAKSKGADGVAVLERMREASGITAEYLGLPPLDCRWTLPRQKLITAAHRDYPEHGHELGAEILRGFRELAFGWSPEARLTAWSVEALFAPVNVGKRLQARPRPPTARAAPEEKPAVAAFDFGPGIGATA